MSDKTKKCLDIFPWSKIIADNISVESVDHHADIG